MPPEPVPWDRKDLFRERKNERSSSENLGGGGSGGGGGGGAFSRWRDGSSHPHRWGSGDFRRSNGYGKQGGWHTLPEDSFHGSGGARSNDKMLDDERSRTFGKYGRSSSRENRGGPGPFSKRDWRGHGWDAGTAPLNGSARVHADMNDRRSVDDMLTYNTHKRSDCGNSGNSGDRLQLKDQNVKNGVVDDLRRGQTFEGENSLGSIDWKPMKWTRSGSLTSRGSGFSHSSSSKSMGVDLIENKAEGLPKNVSPIQSPSVNNATASSAACVSSVPSEETCSRKKPRLGWGEGLAKYEKKKVDVPIETAENNGVVCQSNNEPPVHCQIPTVIDRSPGVQGFLDCASPTTPSSVACSSSPGAEDKASVKMVHVDAANLCNSRFPESQNQCDLANLEVTIGASLGSSLGELLQSDNLGCMDSDFVRSSALNKLLVLKADISKKLEVTESEIDSLENELKSLISVGGTLCPFPASSSSLLVAGKQKHSDDPCVTSSLIPRPAPLQLHSWIDLSLETAPNASEGEVAGSRDEEIDSPGTATSKFAEVLPYGKPVLEDDALKYDEHLLNVDTTKETEVTLVSVDNEECIGAKSSKHVASSSYHHILSSDVGLRRENTLCDSIMASNKDSAHIASEVLNEKLPPNLSCTEISGFEISGSWKINTLVKEKFAMRKRFLMFKERVITLKFRAFQHLWKEDLRLLSMRRCSAKSQKKLEPSLRISHSSIQKHRSSSVRSRFSSPAGNLSLVPTSEVINFASKLLTDSHVKMYRSGLKMPALILDKKERTMSQFTSTNGLVEDPCAAEKERCMINPWTPVEKDIFLDKLATFGKDFRKIASFLDHKTTADCVEFYYKNHKSECFQKTKKQPEFAKQRKSCSTSIYMITSGKRWSHDNSAASLDILGEASAIAANVDDGLKNQQKCATGYSFGTSCDSKATRRTGPLERSNSLEFSANERETVAADVLAGICGSFSSEAMSSCITSSIDLGEGCQERKGQTVGTSVGRSLTPEVTQEIDEETCSDDSCEEMEMDSTDWTDEEKSIFIQAVALYGKDFTMISRCIRTRSRDHCRVFYSKARKCLGLDMMRPGPCGDGTAAGDNTNSGDGSDGEDACVVEDEPVICNDEQDFKKDGLSSSPLEVSCDDNDIAGTRHVRPELDQLEEDNKKGESDANDPERTSETITSDECVVDKMDLDIESVSNIDSCVDRESLAVNFVENAYAISDTNSGQIQADERTLEESITGLEDHVRRKSSELVSEVGFKSEGEVYTLNSRAEKVVDKLLSGSSSMDDKRVNVNLNEFSGTNCSVQSAGTPPFPPGNTCVSVDTDSVGVVSFPAYEHRNAVTLEPVKKVNTDLVKNCNGYMPTNFIIQDTAAVLNEKNLNYGVEQNSEKLRNMQFQSSAIIDGCQLHTSEQSSLDQVDLSKILRGYPVSVSTKNGTNGGLGCNKPALLGAISEVDTNVRSARVLTKNLHLEKCNGLGAQHPPPEDRVKDHLRRSETQSSSGSVKPTRNGDVKLFGQILSQPPTQHKPRMQEKEDKDSKHAKLGDSSSNLKFLGNQNVDGVVASVKFDRNNYLGIENLPVRRSFGFWDGSRIQTGFPSLPDSAILLAKYPAAFSNYPMSASRIEQQQIHPSILRSNDNNFNGAAAAVLPGREINSSKGAPDFQAYRSQDVTRIQPQTVELKQRQNMFLTEMHIRGNEFDAASSVQQQARGMAAFNVRGGGGILVGGGSCTSVSDPVAALRLHYGKTHQFGGQAGSIIRDGDFWRSNGDIGR